MGKYGWLINTNHLKEVRTGYFIHMYYAVKLSLWGFLNPIVGLIHAFIPWIFPGTPHRLTTKQIEMAEELIKDLKKVLDAEDEENKRRRS